MVVCTSVFILTAMYVNKSCVSVLPFSPSPTVSWSYPNSSNAQLISYLSSSYVGIVVSNANAANQGTYTCTGGGTSYSSVLAVRSKSCACTGTCFPSPSCTHSSYI